MDEDRDGDDRMGRGMSWSGEQHNPVKRRFSSRVRELVINTAIAAVLKGDNEAVYSGLRRANVVREVPMARVNFLLGDLLVEAATLLASTGQFDKAELLATNLVTVGNTADAQKFTNNEGFAAAREVLRAAVRARKFDMVSPRLVALTGPHANKTYR